MNIMPKYSPLFHVFMWVAVLIVLLAANKNTVNHYSPYQILVWEIKSTEGYRSWWYKDGYATIKGHRRTSHSIGFGWNDYGGTRRHKIEKYTRDGVVTYQEALQITLDEINKFGRMHADPYKDLALKLYSYNCGRIRSSSNLGKCHGGINEPNKRCGSPYANVRKAHNRRRELELALWKRDWTKIAEITEINRNRVHTQILNVKGGVK